jgi:hypothetical protein
MAPLKVHNARKKRSRMSLGLLGVGRRRSASARVHGAVPGALMARWWLVGSRGEGRLADGVAAPWAGRGQVLLAARRGLQRGVQGRGRPGRCLAWRGEAGSWPRGARRDGRHGRVGRRGGRGRHGAP